MKHSTIQNELKQLQRKHELSDQAKERILQAIDLEINQGLSWKGIVTRIKWTIIAFTSLLAFSIGAYTMIQLTSSNIQESPAEIIKENEEWSTDEQIHVVLREYQSILTNVINSHDPQTLKLNDFQTKEDVTQQFELIMTKQVAREQFDFYIDVEEDGLYVKPSEYDTRFDIEAIYSLEILNSTKIQLTQNQEVEGYGDVAITMIAGMQNEAWMIQEIKYEWEKIDNRTDEYISSLSETWLENAENGYIYDPRFKLGDKKEMIKSKLGETLEEQSANAMSSLESESHLYLFDENSTLQFIKIKENVLDIYKEDVISTLGEFTKNFQDDNQNIEIISYLVGDYDLTFYVNHDTNKIQEIWLSFNTIVE